MKKNLPYGVNDGYFEKMEEELLDIPFRRNSVSALFSPRIAIPALLACASIVLVVFFNTAPNKDLNSAMTEDLVATTLQTDQIEEYLVDSGISVYQLNDLIQ